MVLAWTYASVGMPTPACYNGPRRAFQEQSRETSTDQRQGPATRKEATPLREATLELYARVVLDVRRRHYVVRYTPPRNNK